mmetsp:Transcript_29430/g.51601  ORF Transcript_29430/g.51601 Transcript_29430/m.51601 type:complete len:249 (+) Transcript_29430:56-802(+)
MAVTESELFREYESDFRRLQESIEEQLQASSDVSAPEQNELHCLKEAERHIAKAEQALKQMEMEARTLPTHQRTSLEGTLTRYRTALSEQRRAVSDAKEQAMRKSLLGEDSSNGANVIGKSSKDRERFRDVGGSLHDSTDKLQQAHRVALETEQVGIDVMSDLRSQRDVINRTRGNVAEIGANYSQAKHMLEDMMRRAKANKLITMAAVIFLLIFTLVAVYMFMHKSSGSGSSSSSDQSAGTAGDSSR